MLARDGVSTGVSSSTGECLHRSSDHTSHTYCGNGSKKSLVDSSITSFVHERLLGSTLVAGTASGSLTSMYGMYQTLYPQFFYNVMCRLSQDGSRSPKLNHEFAFREVKTKLASDHFPIEQQSFSRTNRVHEKLFVTSQPDISYNGDKPMQNSENCDLSATSVEDNFRGMKIEQRHDSNVVESSSSAYLLSPRPRVVFKSLSLAVLRELERQQQPLAVDGLSTVNSTGGVATGSKGNDEQAPAAASIAVNGKDTPDSEGQRNTNEEFVAASGNSLSNLYERRVFKAGTPQSVEANFLLAVKAKVAAMSRQRSLGALELAERRFECGALLSGTSDSSSSSSINDKEDLLSVRSNDAIVGGRISPEKAHAYLKAQLQREGKSENSIAYELACHMSPVEVRRQQRRRRRQRNVNMMRRRREVLRKREQKFQREQRERRIHEDESTTVGGDILAPQSPNSVPTQLIGSPQSPASASIQPSEQENVSSLISENLFDKAATVATAAGSGIKNMLAAVWDHQANDMSFSVENIATFRENKKEEFKHSIPPRASSTAKIGDITANANPGYTHDDKVVARRRQKYITNRLTQLQKMRDRGELSPVLFEEAKLNIFQEIFDCDASGNIIIRRSDWSMMKKKRCRDSTTVNNTLLLNTTTVPSSGIMAPSLKRQRLELRSEGCKAVLSNNEENMPGPGEHDLDFSEADHATSDEDDEDESILLSGTHVEVYRHDDFTLRKGEGGQYSVPLEERQACRAVIAERRRQEMCNALRNQKKNLRRERRRRLRNFERRAMLMRRFDQRAPPEARMFKQDTSYRRDGQPTCQQKEDWDFWHTPEQLLPDWMRGTKEGRQIIFPDDLKKF